MLKVWYVTILESFEDKPMSKLQLSPHTLLVVFRSIPGPYLMQHYPYEDHVGMVEAGYICEVLEAGASAQRMGMTPGNYVVLDCNSTWHSRGGHRLTKVTEVLAVIEGPMDWES